MSTTRTAILLCLLLYNTIGSHRAASQPVIVASPPEIDVGLSDTLDVNCTVSVAGWSSVGALISLTVKRNSSQTGWTELAIINDFSNGQVNVMTTENLMSNGWFKNSGSASVNLHWDYPTDQQAGNYVCSTQGFDSVGHTLVSNIDVQVSAHSPGLSDIQDKLRQMDMQMKESQSKTEALELKVLKLDSLELKVTELIKEKQSRISQMFETSFVYRNHKYYVSRDAFFDIHASLAICRIFGGYLTEVDDKDEYNAISTFLLSTSGFHRAYISGTDQDNEGTWTLFSGEPLPFVEWVPNRPANSDFHNCLMFWLNPGHGWQMHDFPCHHDEPENTSRFMCEVPQL